jgi:alpha-tubulin suppressor-like RCC1 family protein
LRVTFQNNTGSLVAQTFINQLGTTNVSQFVGTLSNSWSIGNTYPSGSLVVNNNGLYQANTTIPAGTAFVEGDSGTTWRAIGEAPTIPENGETFLTTNVSITTTPGTDILTANIPSAGTWQINYYANINWSAAGAMDEGRVFLVDNSGNQINGSQSWGYITDQSNMAAVYSNQIILSTTSPTTVTLRGVRLLGNNMIALGTANSAGTKIIWNKIGGYLPSNGTISTSRSATLSTTLVGGGFVFQDMTNVFNSVGNLPLSNSGVWTLTAGVTYQLECSLTYDAGGSNQFQGDTAVAFVDATTNVRLPNQQDATLITPLFTGRGIFRTGYNIFQYTPSTNQTIKLRVVYQSNAGSLMAQTFVNQLGTTNVSQFVGTLSNSWSIGNTYPSGTLVVNDDALYQANTTIPVGTPFQTGVSGSTWTPIGSSALRNITKIALRGWGSGLLVADNKIYTFNGTQGNGNWIRAVANGTGSNFYGLDSMREVIIPNETGNLIDAGSQSSQAYALFDNGNLWMWGYNGQGQLGIGNTTDQFYPVLSTTNVTRVYSHPAQDARSDAFGRWFILKTDGKVYGTGYNGFGELGVGNTTDRNTWTEITGAGLNPKSVWTLGSYAGTTIIQRSDNTIWVCGYNGFGQLGNGNTTNQTSFVNVTTAWNGGDNNMVIQEVGYGGGYNDGSTIEATSITLFMDNGTTSRIASSGNNNWGQLGDGTFVQKTSPVTPTGFSGRVSKMVRIGGSPGSVWLLRTDRTLWNWGYNAHGQLDRGNTTTTPTPAQVETDVLDISIHNHTWFEWNYQVASPVVRKSDGYYRCGYNGHGQVGDGTQTNRSSLVKMRFPAGIVIKMFGALNGDNEIATFYAIDNTNKIWAWGGQSYFTIYPHSSEIIPTPVQFVPSVLIK